MPTIVHKDGGGKCPTVAPKFIWELILLLAHGISEHYPCMEKCMNSFTKWIDNSMGYSQSLQKCDGRCLKRINVDEGHKIYFSGWDNEHETGSWILHVQGPC